MKRSLPALLLALCCLLGSSLSAQENSPVTPAPRTGTAHDRFILLNERVQAHQGPLDILFIGDSITQGWERAGSEVWDEFYGNRKALNIGIGGDWTQHVLWRLENGNAEGLEPKVAVIMIGTNNSGPNRHQPAQILEGVQTVVAKVREMMPETQILLLGIFPRGETFNDQRGQILQVNQALHVLAGEEKVSFLDFGHRFLAPDGSIPKGLMPDFLHLSPEGYRIWAEAMEPVLARLLDEAP